MKLKVLGMLAAVSAVALASCSANSQKKETAQVEVVSEEVCPVTMFGVYEGTLPAADCDGIKTMLTVNPDSTYLLRSEYIGVEDGVFETSGVYNLIGGDLIELITPSSGEKTYSKLIVDGVRLSDSMGTVNQGDLAKYYVLSKQ